MRKTQLIQELCSRGAKEQLLMFLSGKAGSGKSHVIKTALAFLKKFCNNCDIPFDSDVVKVTAVTGCAAANLKIPGATTIDRAAHLTNLNPKRQHPDWINTNLLFIDEISFMSTMKLEKLDRYLKIQTGRSDVLFGGVHIVFAGDFYQIPPVMAENKALYMGNNVQWGALNAVIFLVKNHRFKDDPEYGELLERIAKGEATKKDIETINSRVITGKKNSIKDVPHPQYACAKNSERNSISTDIFRQHVKDTHKNSLKSPTHTIIIESLISKTSHMGKKHSVNHHTTIYNNCGDADIQSANKRTNKHVDPALKLFTGIPIMLNSNEYIEQGRGNGTLARFKKVVLKNDSTLTSKLWDGYHVNTVSVDDVKFIVCEHWKDSGGSNDNQKPPRKFKLYPEITKVNIKMQLFGSKKNLRLQISI